MDITNLNTKENPSKYLEYYRQVAVMSATNLFAAAVNALTVQPSLEKVVILKQIPRYDPAEVDPLSLKPVLSCLFNSTLTDLWMTCPNKDNIVIGNHNIDCTGGIKESRYREFKTGRYDGIHLYGSSGRKAYTKSVLNILKTANLTSPDYDDHQSCAQTKYQRRRNVVSGYRQNVQRNVSRNTRQRGNNYYRNVTSQPTGYAVPTYNRFESFSGPNQGNW